VTGAPRRPGSVLASVAESLEEVLKVMDATDRRLRDGRR
jgi:hypothetical protein